MKPAVAILEPVLVKVNRIFVFVASLMLIGLIVLVNFDLFMRCVFRSPIMGLTEVTEIFLLYMTFLGTAWVYKEDSHVVVDVVLYNLLEKRKKFLMLQNHVIVGIVSVILTYYGFLTTFDHFVRGVRNPTILETPIALVIAIIPIGGLMLFLEVVVKFVSTLLSKEV